MRIELQKSIEDLCISATRCGIIADEISAAVKVTQDQLDNWLSVLAAHQTFLDPGPKERAKHYPRLLDYAADHVWAAIRNMLVLPPWMVANLGDVEREVRAARDGYTLIR